jgi:hypothetical protein
MGALGIFALIVLSTLVATVLGAVIWLAILPGRIAVQRKHPQAEAIRIAGWFGIITGAVWILALIWAYTSVGLDEQADDGLRLRLSEFEQRLAVLEGGEVSAEGGTS